jgi:hypothetical protein
VPSGTEVVEAGFETPREDEPSQLFLNKQIQFLSLTAAVVLWLQMQPQPTSANARQARRASKLRPAWPMSTNLTTPALVMRRFLHIQRGYWIFRMLKIGPEVIRSATRVSLELFRQVTLEPSRNAEAIFVCRDGSVHNSTCHATAAQLGSQCRLTRVIIRNESEISLSWARNTPKLDWPQPPSEKLLIKK